MGAQFLSARVFPLLENETISNYLRQIQNIASEHERATLRRALGKAQTANCSPLYPSNLQAMREVIPSLPSLTDTLRNNTGVQVMRLTVSPGDYERFYRHSVFGERQPIAVLSGITKNRSQRGPITHYFEEALCLECIDEDRVTHGRTFVRRQWAYSKIGACTKHRASLWTACERCRSSTKYKNLLHRLDGLCACGTSRLVNRTRSDRSAVFASELRVADALDAFFRIAADPKLDSRNTRYVYRRQALKLGFLTSRYQYEQIVRLAEMKLHAEVIEKHEMRFSKGSGAAEMLRGDASLRSPLENALFVSTLFDSAEEFEVAMNESKGLTEQELLSPVRNVSWRKKATSDKKLEQRKKQVKDYVEANPGATRTDVQRALSHHFRVLRQHDPQAFDELLPTRKPRPDGATRPPVEYEEEDRRYEKYVRQRHAEYQQQPPDFRVTKARLKKGWRGAGSFPTNKWRLPLTLAALNELEESAEAFRRRNKTQQ